MSAPRGMEAEYKAELAALRAKVAALEAAQIASEVERTDVHEEVKALRTALKTAEADARRLEALAGERATMQVRHFHLLYACRSIIRILTKAYPGLTCMCMHMPARGKLPGCATKMLSLY